MSGRYGKEHDPFALISTSPEVLQHLVQQNAVREFVVGRDASRTKWMFSVPLGGPHSRLIPVRSRREVIRTWASLTAVGRFAEGLGVRGFAVEL